MSVVTKNAQADTFINQLAPNTSYGEYDYVQVSGADTKVRKGLVSWDFTGLTSSKLVGGRLRLYILVNNTGTITVSIYRMLKAWSESDATWHRATTTVNWDTGGMRAGVDYSETAMATSTWTVDVENTWYEIDLLNLSELKAMVDAGSGYGLCVIVTTGTDLGSHNFEAVDKVDTANEAQLILTYAGGGEAAFLNDYGVL